MKKNRVLGASLLGVLVSGVSSLALAQPAAAPTDAQEARIEQLESQVSDLAAEVQDLKRGQAAQIDTLSDVQAKQTPPSVLATLANGVPSLKSADGQFVANFHGILQFDAGGYAQRGPGTINSSGTGTDNRRSGPALGASSTNVDLTHARELKDGDLFRRARIGVDGKAFGDWDYRLIFDFAGAGVENAGQLYEGWVQYSGLKPFHLRVGAFAPSIGLDDAASTNGMPLLERSAVEDIARGFAAGDTRTAVQLWAASDRWLGSVALTGRTVGVANSAALGTAQTYGDQVGIVGRVAGTPFVGSDWLVHVGAHGSYVAEPANTGGPTTYGAPFAPNSRTVAFANTQELRIDGTKLINTGNIPANNASTVGFEFAVQKQNFLLQSEYEQFNVGRSDSTKAVPISNPTFHGWYVSGSWVLTGERRNYNKTTAAFDAPTVAHPFSWANGGLGAWELAARYSDTDLNYDAGPAGSAPKASSIRGGDEQNFTVGLNWYPNSFVKFMLDYSYVEISRLSPCGGATALTGLACTGASTWQTTTGSQIGQNYSAIALRSQFAF